MNTPTPNSDAIDRFRSNFHRGHLVHLNNAGSAPSSRPAREAIEHWLRRLYEEGEHSIVDLIAALGTARTDVATFLGCRREELAFFQGPAAAISQVALGLDLKPGDEIITWDQEYPSNHYPWMEAARRRGAKLVLAESGSDLSTPVATLEKLITPRTKVIAVSWVQYRSGAITDLEKLTAIARPHGIFVCADIIQGAGVLPFDFASSGLDAACGGSHKWLTSPHGAGFLCSRQEHLERLQPVMVGAMTFGTPDDRASMETKPRKTAERFEPGSTAFTEIIALAASCQLFRETGVDRIAQEAEWLARRAVHGLRERGYIVHSPHGSHHRGAMVNFNTGPDAPLKTQAEIAKRLQERNISFGQRPPGIRLAPHAFNTAADIDALLEALA